MRFYDDYPAIIDELTKRPLSDIARELIELRQIAKAYIWKNTNAFEISVHTWKKHYYEKE